MSTVTGMSANDIRTDYLNLLVSQLRNQNPLDPVSNSEMASQLAQLSQLEQLESISSTFQKVFLGFQLSQARELIGKVVSFVPAGTNSEYLGLVDGVDIRDGEVFLRLGDYLLGLDEVRSIYGTEFQNDHLAEQVAQATALIGKEVTFLAPDETGQLVEVSGQVESVAISDGQVSLNVGEHVITIDEILKIKD